jgi:hypothetical protein
MLYNLKKKEAEGKAYLAKLQANRKKAAKNRKAYWQARIDAYFLDGVVK